MTYSPVAPGRTRRWLLDRLDFTVDPALGPTIRGRFDRAAGRYEVGPGGARIELAVDVSSIDTGNAIWDGLVRRFGQDPVRLASTRVDEAPGGKLRVEASLDAAGRFQPVTFDAALREVDRVLEVEAATTVDRQQLGNGADRLAAFLPATVHLTMRFSS